LGEFYKKVQETVEKEKEFYTLIMGDWNGKVGKKEEGEGEIGQFGYGERNESGERIVEIARANNCKIVASFF